MANQDNNPKGNRPKGSQAGSREPKGSTPPGSHSRADPSHAGQEQAGQEQAGQEQDRQSEEPSPREIFKSRFISLLADLGKNATRDPETIWLIGSLAGSILADTKAPSWPALKSSLSAQGYDGLLESLKNQGNRLAEEGEHKSAYAVQTIAISIVAPTMADDEHIATGNELLDKMIADAVDFYHKHPVSKAPD